MRRMTRFSAISTALIAMAASGCESETTSNTGTSDSRGSDAVSSGDTSGLTDVVQDDVASADGVDGLTDVPSTDGSDGSDGLTDVLTPDLVQPDIHSDTGADIKDTTTPDTSLPDVFVGQDTDDAGPVDPNPFLRLNLSTEAPAVAFVAVGLVDDDDVVDVVASEVGFAAAGPFPGLSAPPIGRVVLYRRDATDALDSWSASIVVPDTAGISYPNEPHLADVDEDGDTDVILPAGSSGCASLGIPIPGLGGGPCGALIWYEQDTSGTPTTWIPHDIVPKGSEYYFTRVELVDLDGDGFKDLVTVGEKMEGGFGGIGGSGTGEAITQWFKGNAEVDRFEATPFIIGSGLGASLQAIDVDFDEDMDFVSAEYAMGATASFAWFEQLEPPYDDFPAGVWARHVIGDDVGPSRQMRVIPDLYADGAVVAIGTNNANPTGLPPFVEGDPWTPGVYAYTMPDGDPTAKWTGELVSAGIMPGGGDFLSAPKAPGLFDFGNVDGDADIDLVVSGDGDPRMFWLEQTGPGSFVTHVLDPNVPKTGGVRVADLNDDGMPEAVVACASTNTIYIYQWVGWPAGTGDDGGDTDGTDGTVGMADIVEVQDAGSMEDVDGVDGTDGADGATGVDDVDGSSGADGSVGADDVDGATGTDAPEDAGPAPEEDAGP